MLIKSLDRIYVSVVKVTNGYISNGSEVKVYLAAAVIFIWYLCIIVRPSNICSQVKKGIPGKNAESTNATSGTDYVFSLVWYGHLLKHSYMKQILNIDMNIIEAIFSHLTTQKIAA